jgi:uncharacterized protein YqkB
MAYMVLDTTTNIMWHYKKATSNAWLRLNLLPSDTASMLTNYWRSGRFSGTLPLLNGGTGSATQNFVDLTTTQTVGGAKTFSETITGARFNPTATTVTGTGMFLPAANTLGFSNNGTQNMTILAGGNVGIGTIAPAAPLHIQKTSAGAATIAALLTNNNGTAGTETRLAFTTLNNDPASNRYGYISYVINGVNGGDLKFATNVAGEAPVEALRILNNGNVGIGTIAPLSKLNIMGTVRINSASAPDANYYLQLENSASQKAKANAWDTYSDSRIKTNRQPIINAIDKINLLNPTYYNQHDSYVEDDLLNIDYNNSYKSLGFIAQEVYEVIPEAVNMGTTNELWAMDYTKLIPILTKAIQEQQALIKALEQRIINLENK